MLYRAVIFFFTERILIHNSHENNFFVHFYFYAAISEFRVILQNSAGRLHVVMRFNEVVFLSFIIFLPFIGFLAPVFFTATLQIHFSLSIPTVPFN